jgi:AraC-like DNA-binding protein
VRTAVKLIAADFATMEAMASTHDLFGRFVELVSTDLDRPDADTAAIASRLFISRSQLDRIVTAVAGEAPGQFRRRILLERAAHRLLDRHTGVLDVAIEAGYSSHEAFTRAFRRAYGLPPSEWRVESRVTSLHTPNGVHFYAPGGLRLPSRAERTPMDFPTVMVEHHLWVTDQMIERASTMSDEQLDAPIVISVEGVDDHPTTRSLLSRLVGQLDMWNHSVANQPYDFAVEEHESIDSMRSRLSVAAPVFLGHVRDTARNGAFDETFVDATCDPPMFLTYGGMIAHVLTYAAHRRTLVAGALYSAGITDVADDPLAWPTLRGSE